MLPTITDRPIWDGFYWALNLRTEGFEMLQRGSVYYVTYQPLPNFNMRLRKLLDRLTGEVYKLLCSEDEWNDRVIVGLDNATDLKTLLSAELHREVN